MGLGALNLSFAYTVRQTGPLAQGKVDQIINAADVVGNQVDTPKTVASISKKILDYVFVATYPVSL